MNLYSVVKYWNRLLMGSIEIDFNWCLDSQC